MSDASLKRNLKEIIHNALRMMEGSKKLEDRRSLFNEYKEWLGESINDDVLYLSRDFNASNNEKTKLSDLG